MRQVTIIEPTESNSSSASADERRKKRVAGYARVSTDHDEQFSSYTAQIDYYTNYIKSHPEWEFVKVYTDEGISGTRTANREGFLSMIDDALAGRIDLIVTKSLSRFARNTVDSLSYIRKLSEKGVEVFFEKENIHTLEINGEVLIAIMSSLAQEESRSISENVTWGMRKRFSDGKILMCYSKFLGYRKGADGMPEIVESEAETVRLIYRLFLEGRTPCWIAKHLTEQGIPTATGKKKWDGNIVTSILRNEKYKGEALLQKTFTTDFLTKQVKKNNGELPQYLVRNSHPAIIPPRQWDMVQLEFERRQPIGRSYRSVDIFSSKIYCGDCGSFYGKKVMHSNDKYRKEVFFCNKKYEGNKCKTPALTEGEIKSAFIAVYNQFIGDMDFLLTACGMVRSIISNSFELKGELSALTAEATSLEHDLRVDCLTPGRLINASDEYTERYNRYAEVRERIIETEHELQDRERRVSLLDSFLETIKNNPSALDEWDEVIWRDLVSKATVFRDKTIVFRFINGTEIRVNVER